MSINRTIQPKSNNIENLNYLHPEQNSLINGIPLYKVNSGTQDVLKIEFYFKAGLFYQSKKLVASITNKMLSLGTKSYSAYDIAEQIDTYGAYLDTSVDKDNANVSLYCLNKHIDKLLPLFKEVICEPRFSEKEFSILINKIKQEHSINLEKVKYLARVNFNQFIYGENHPYGMKLENNDFDKIDISDIKCFFDNYYTLKNCKIIVSGKIPYNIEDLLNTYFNMNRNGLDDSLDIEYNFIDPEPIKHKITKEGALQSAIRIGKPIINRSHPDFIKLSILNTIFGGYFGSRLMSNIREDKGYTYGIGSTVLSLKQNGFFCISTEVGNEYTEASIIEIYKELDILRSTKISETELNLVKNYMIGQIIRGLDGPFAIGDRLKMLINFNLPFNYYQNFVNEIKETTSQNLIELANKYMAENSLIELQVGN